MATTQYIGARYVPILADPVEWSSAKTYEPLTIVMHEGNSYTSRQSVPIGIDIENEQFWAITGNYNAQVEQYRRETNQAVEQINDWYDAAVAEYADKYGAKPFAFETVESMARARDLLYVGAICHTNGFYVSGDGGAAWYIIGDSGEANAKDIIACGATLRAYLITTKDEMSPESFGAHGNGIDDDSEIIRYMLSNNYKIKAVGKYYIGSSIVDGVNTQLHITGNMSHNVWYEIPDKSCFIIKDGVSIFANARLEGYIDDCAFVGEGAHGQTSITTQYVFNTCTLTSFTITNCLFYNFESAFYNTTISANSFIAFNKFLSVYNFFKADDAFHAFNDSTLLNNYINGGLKYNDNVFFKGDAISQTNFSQNFIDFYQTMYDTRLRQSTLNVVSIGNRYEAFRYFLASNNYQRYVFTSIGDAFEHMDENDQYLTHNKDYKSDTVIYSGVEYDIPPCLFHVYSQLNSITQIKFIGARFGVNCFESALFDATGQSPYSAAIGAKLYLDFTSRIYTGLKIWYSQTSGANGITFYGDNCDFFECTYITELDTQPEIVSGYIQQYQPGMLYRYNGNVYKCIKYMDNGTGKIVLQPICAKLPTIERV